MVSLHQVGLAQGYCEGGGALRDRALVFDGPAAALTPAFLRDLYGTAVDELLLDEPVERAVAPVPIKPRRVDLAAAA